MRLVESDWLPCLPTSMGTAMAAAEVNPDWLPCLPTSVGTAMAAVELVPEDVTNQWRDHGGSVGADGMGSCSWR